MGTELLLPGAGFAWEILLTTELVQAKPDPAVTAVFFTGKDALAKLSSLA